MTDNLKIQGKYNLFAFNHHKIAFVQIETKAQRLKKTRSAVFRFHLVH